MKRNILIIICLFLLTGCDALYNINISSDRIDESTNFQFYERDYNYAPAPFGIEINHYNSMEELTESIMNEDYKAFDNNYNSKKSYKKERISDDAINFKYEYSYDNFINSSMLNYCGKDVSFINDKDYILLYSEISSSCFMVDYGSNLDKLTININTNLDVLEHNADEVKGNTYIWNVDVGSVLTKKIKIKIKKSFLRKSKEFSGIILIIVIIIGVVGYIVYSFLKKKNMVNDI